MSNVNQYKSHFDGMRGTDKIDDEFVISIVTIFFYSFGVDRLEHVQHNMWRTSRTEK